MNESVLFFSGFGLGAFVATITYFAWERLRGNTGTDGSAGEELHRAADTAGGLADTAGRIADEQRESEEAFAGLEQSVHRLADTVELCGSILEEIKNQNGGGDD